MIAYYVHHVGSGHLHRATALAARLDQPMTGLSSLPRPPRWAGDWVQLERDDLTTNEAGDTAGGFLHWAPYGDPGLRGRMAAVSAWIEEADPDLLVSDVSVEIALLARLHGVPVVSVVLPGDRSDRAHQLGYAASHELVSFWPPSAEGMAIGVGGRLRPLGGLSRFPLDEVSPHRSTSVRRVVVLNGRGGGGPTGAQLDAARRQTPEWEWEVLGGPDGRWVPDPFPVIGGADVVVTHAGQNAIAEVAAVRRPAVVVPAVRPHDEQVTTAGVLGSGRWPAVVEPTFPETGWAERLERAAALDGQAWAPWCDGRAAERFAEVVASFVLRPVAR